MTQPQSIWQEPTMEGGGGGGLWKGGGLGVGKKVILVEGRACCLGRIPVSVWPMKS